MSRRPKTVIPAYRPIKTSELKPIAEVYKAMLAEPGVLALFETEDASVNASWVAAFEDSIQAVGNIVPSRVIMKTNKDLTKAIKEHSKKCVKYGKVLRYYLKKAFAGQPGLQNTFTVVEANNKMRQGDMEGFVAEVNTIVQQLVANEAALIAAGWPVQNRINYESMKGLVEGLNTEQELAKMLVPENTDKAIATRNVCYGFIQTLLRLKDVVYYDDLEKRHGWMVKTILKRMRSGGM